AARSPDLSDYVANHAQAVLERTAVAALPRLGAGHLAQQVTVRDFDVDGAKASFHTEPRGGDVVVFQALQLVIADDGTVRRRVALPVNERIVINDRPGWDTVAA